MTISIVPQAHGKLNKYNDIINPIEINFSIWRNDCVTQFTVPQTTDSQFMFEQNVLELALM